MLFEEVEFVLEDPVLDDPDPEFEVFVELLFLLLEPEDLELLLLELEPDVEELFFVVPLALAPVWVCAGLPVTAF